MSKNAAGEISMVEIKPEQFLKKQRESRQRCWSTVLYTVLFLTFVFALGACIGGLATFIILCSYDVAGDVDKIKEAMTSIIYLLNVLIQQLAAAGFPPP